MRTLHIDLGREMGGGQWQVVYLLERLKDARLIARESSPLFRIARERGIDVGPPALYVPSAEIVHAHDARAHTWAILRSFRSLVVSRRVAFPIGRSIFSRWKYRQPDAYLAVSRFVARKLMDARVPEEIISVVYDGVPIPDEPGSMRGGVIAIRGKCEDMVVAAAKAVGVPIQFSANLWQDLSSARLLVYASEMEGLGSGALAAMAWGVPVIATPAGGLPEIVEHERTGLLVEASGIGAALRRLLDRPDEAARMGRQGRELVKKKFSVDQMVEATKNVYQGVLRS
jgi:hypothetical protein